MTIRVCLVQPSVPLYRAPVFELLGSTPGIVLTVWAARSLPGGPATGNPLSYKHFNFVEAPVRSVGPFLSQHAQLRVVRANRYDVVILPWGIRYLELVPALVRARACGVRTVLWGNGVSDRMFELDEAQFRRKGRETLGHLANACLLYGDAVADRLRATTLPAQKVFVARNSIDQTHIQAARTWWNDRPDLLRQFQLENDLVGKDLILFISRLHADKRADLLLDALALLSDRFPLCRIAIIGDGAERQRLEAQAIRLGIADRVKFVGALYEEQQIAPWCLSAAAFAIPGLVGLSIQHTFGYGLPVVTAYFPEYPEIEALRDGVNGFFNDAKDATSVASMLALLLSDPERRTRMSSAASDTIAAGGFTLEEMVAGFVAAIGAAIGSPPPRGPSSAKIGHRVLDDPDGT